jgi:hypothetical protein
MATEREAGTGNSWLAFLVGALLVGLLVVGYFVFSGRSTESPQSRDFNLKIETPNLPTAPAPAPDPIPAPQ